MGTSVCRSDNHCGMESSYPFPAWGMVDYSHQRVGVSVDDNSYRFGYLPNVENDDFNRGCLSDWCLSVGGDGYWITESDISVIR